MNPSNYLSPFFKNFLLMSFLFGTPVTLLFFFIDYTGDRTLSFGQAMLIGYGCGVSYGLAMSIYASNRQMRSGTTPTDVRPTREIKLNLDYDSAFEKATVAVGLLGFKMKSSDKTNGVITATKSNFLLGYNSKVTIDLKKKDNFVHLKISSRPNSFLHKFQIYDGGQNIFNVQNIINYLGGEETHILSPEYHRPYSIHYVKVRMLGMAIAIIVFTIVGSFLFKDLYIPFLPYPILGGKESERNLRVEEFNLNDKKVSIIIPKYLESIRDEKWNGSYFRYFSMPEENISSIGISYSPNITNPNTPCADPEAKPMVKTTLISGKEVNVCQEENAKAPGYTMLSIYYSEETNIYYVVILANKTYVATEKGMERIKLILKSFQVLE